jgi:hypothetical protein
MYRKLQMKMDTFDTNIPALPNEKTFFVMNVPDIPNEGEYDCTRAKKGV